MIGTYVQYLLFSAKRLLQSFPGFFRNFSYMSTDQCITFTVWGGNLFQRFFLGFFKQFTSSSLRKHIVFTKPSEQVVAPDCTIKRQNDVWNVKLDLRMLLAVPTFSLSFSFFFFFSFLLFLPLSSGSPSPSTWKFVSAQLTKISVLSEALNEGNVVLRLIFFCAKTFFVLRLFPRFTVHEGKFHGAGC